MAARAFRYGETDATPRLHHPAKVPGVEVRPLEVGRNPFKPGDLIITSGTGGLYPPRVPVARVVKLKDDGAIALPLADPATTSFAIVEPPYEPEAIAAENEPDTDAP